MADNPNEAAGATKAQSPAGPTPADPIEVDETVSNKHTAPRFVYRQ